MFSRTAPPHSAPLRSNANHKGPQEDSDKRTKTVTLGDYIRAIKQSSSTASEHGSSSTPPDQTSSSSSSSSNDDDGNKAMSGDGKNPEYLFGSFAKHLNDKKSPYSRLVSQYITPPHFATTANFKRPDASRFERQLFFIGKPWSGAYFHEHGSSWNGLVYGEKLWFLVPPSRSWLGGEHAWESDVPGLTMAEWVERVMPVVAGE